MANPQKENGYIAISTELFEAMILFRFPGECGKVFLAIMRKTYGFNKKEDAIANSQLVKLTGMKKGNVSRSLSRLIDHGLVIKTDNKSKKGNILMINKDYQDWKPFVIKTDNSKKVIKTDNKKLSKLITPVIKTDNKVLSELMDTKDNNHLYNHSQKTREKTPAQNASIFFKGIDDLMSNTESSEADQAKEFLQRLEAKYQTIPKTLIWAEIKKFHNYWTELNHTGTKQRWQKQEAFQVDRRLATWFLKADQFQRSSISNKGKEIII